MLTDILDIHEMIQNKQLTYEEGSIQGTFDNVPNIQQPVKLI